MTTKEQRLIEMNSAWRARADEDARIIRGLIEAVHERDRRIAELEWSLKQVGELYDLAQATIKAIGERKATRPARVTEMPEQAEGTAG